RLSTALVTSVLSTPSARRRSVASFPTRRSSDLAESGPSPGRLDPRDTAGNDFPVSRGQPACEPPHSACPQGATGRPGQVTRASSDRKSTRLNSSHVSISYAVFCLKKKTESVAAI